MIPCPVGSIFPGHNGQIEIEDWCIGCEKCATACPYDSIQMHDLGLLSEDSPEWVFAARDHLGEDWYRVTNLEKGWRLGKSPFSFEGDFIHFLKSLKSKQLKICFRHEIRVPEKKRPEHFRLFINDPSRCSDANFKKKDKKTIVHAVYFNGQKLDWSGTVVELPSEKVKLQNLLAIEVHLEMPEDYGHPIFVACFDAVKEVAKRTLEILGEDVRVKLTQPSTRAVVCDLCSNIPSQTPACVTSCPHDAALRINPLVNFPI